MSIKRWAATALLVASALPMQANASMFTIAFKGPQVSGRVALTYVIDPNVAAVLDTAPNAHDPLGSYIITGVTGTFSNTAANISKETITGIEGLNKVSPEPTNLKAPNRFSLLAISNGVDDGSGHPSAGFHYDNIFYPGGSPQTASDYPFFGGFFDIYGLAFTLANGDAVNLWSYGVLPSGMLDYGVALTDRTDVLHYTDGVSIRAVPEPASWMMMLAGFGALGVTIRRRQRTAVRFV